MNKLEKHEKASRGTGRTWRMVQDAVSLSTFGRAVYIVVLTPVMAEYVKKMLLQFPKRPSIKVELSSSPLMQMFDWNRLRFDDGRPSQYEVLIDHDVMYKNFRCALEMYHRYDKPDPNDNLNDVQVLCP